MPSQTMMVRSLAAALAAVAALMFFFPLLTFQVPLVGREQVSGSDVVARVRDLRQRIRSAFGEDQKDNHGGIHLPRPKRGPAGGAEESSGLPISVRASWLIPFWILAAILCALATTVSSFLLPRLARLTSAAGTFCAVLALAHIAWMNSDIHSMLQQSLGTGPTSPLSGLAQAIGGVLIENSQMQAGFGLYILAICLVLATVAAFSSFLVNLRNAA